MAWEERLECISRPAGEDLSDWNTNKFTVLKLNASSAAVKVGAVTDNPLGILQNDPKLGEPARVATGGVSKARAGGTIAAGDQLGFSATGRVIVAVATHRVIGTAVTGGVTGDIISVNINSANAPIKA